VIDVASDRQRADQQHAVAAGERLRERCRVVEVAGPHLDAPLSKVGEGVRAAAYENELCRRQVVQQVLCGEAAELARRARDDDSHVG
jgi:hypothetical protein